MPRKPRTLLDACVAVHGQYKGGLCAAWVIQWAMLARELGRFPSTAEYVAEWFVSTRTGWYHRAAIHKALGDEYQTVILDLAQEIDARMSRRKAMKLEVATA